MADRWATVVNIPQDPWGPPVSMAICVSCGWVGIMFEHGQDAAGQADHHDWSIHLGAPDQRLHEAPSEFDDGDHLARRTGLTREAFQ